MQLCMEVVHCCHNIIGTRLVCKFWLGQNTCLGLLQCVYQIGTVRVDWQYLAPADETIANPKNVLQNGRIVGSSVLFLSYKSAVSQELSMLDWVLPAVLEGVGQ